MEKHKFNQHQSPISINNIDIDKIAVSNKVSFGIKCFIGHKIIKKLHLHVYRRGFDETKYMSFL